MTVLELKQRVCTEFGIPVHIQQWVLGKQLSTDDTATLHHYHVTADGAPLFLYLVAPGGK